MVSFERAKAMAQKCRKVGGDCPCERRCEAERALVDVREECSRIIAQTWQEIERLNRKPAVVREDWTMPPKPAGDYVATVISEGDGWSPHWYSETERVEYIEFPPGNSSWPFVDETAYGTDWEALGFVVV